MPSPGAAGAGPRTDTLDHELGSVITAMPAARRAAVRAVLLAARASGAIEGALARLLAV